MLVGNKNIIPPPFELWLPDFADFTLPRKPDGSCYTDKHDYDSYLDWLVDHLDANHFPLAPHQAEIISAPDKTDWDAVRVGLSLGAAAISEFYFLGSPSSTTLRIFSPTLDRNASAILKLLRSTAG